MLAYGVVSLRPHCSLQFYSARLVIVTAPGCCWASSALSV